MPYLVTPDQVPLFYADEGPREDRAIFLLHGEPFNTKFWQKNIPILAQKFRVISMDVRGRGESGKSDQGQNMDQWSVDFRFVMESLGLTSTVAVGWSMGSAIIWNYVRLYGEKRIAGFVNVDQRPYRFISFDHLQERLAVIAKNRLANHRKVVEEYFGPEIEESSAVIDWMAYECMKTPTSIHRAAAIESYLADFRPVLPKITVPSMLVCPKYGVVNDEWAAYMEEKISGAKIVRFEKSGHMVPWTESEKFNTELLTFAEHALK